MIPDLVIRFILVVVIIITIRIRLYIAHSRMLYNGYVNIVSRNVFTFTYITFLLPYVLCLVSGPKEARTIRCSSTNKNARGTHYEYASYIR